MAGAGAGLGAGLGAGAGLGTGRQRFVTNPKSDLHGLHEEINALNF